MTLRRYTTLHGVIAHLCFQDNSNPAQPKIVPLCGYRPHLRQRSEWFETGQDSCHCRKCDKHVENLPLLVKLEMAEYALAELARQWDIEGYDCMARETRTIAEAFSGRKIALLKILIASKGGDAF